MLDQFQNTLPALEIVQSALASATPSSEPVTRLLGNDAFLIVLAQVLPVLLLFIALKPTDPSKLDGKTLWIALILFFGGILEVLILMALFAATQAVIPDSFTFSVAIASIVVIGAVLFTILASPFAAAIKGWRERRKQIDHQKEHEDRPMNKLVYRTFRIGWINIKYEEKTEWKREEPSAQQDK